jgi:hypothetical protein
VRPLFPRRAFHACELVKCVINRPEEGVSFSYVECSSVLFGRIQRKTLTVQVLAFIWFDVITDNLEGSEWMNLVLCHFINLCSKRDLGSVCHVPWPPQGYYCSPSHQFKRLIKTSLVGNIICLEKSGDMDMCDSRSDREQHHQQRTK